MSKVEPRDALRAKSHRETAQHRKLEAFERNWRNRRYQHFSMTIRGRMSWADWFNMRTFS